MSSLHWTYERGAELPGLDLPWEEESSQDVWTALDFTATAHTFALDLIDSAGVTQLAKTTSITGYDGGVQIAWDVDDLDIPAGEYTFKLRATETGSSKNRDYRPADPPRLTIT